MSFCETWPKRRRKKKHPPKMQTAFSTRLRYTFALLPDLRNLSGQHDSGGTITNRVCKQVPLSVATINSHWIACSCLEWFDRENSKTNFRMQLNCTVLRREKKNMGERERERRRQYNGRFVCRGLSWSTALVTTLVPVRNDCLLYVCVYVTLHDMIAAKWL